MTRWRLPRRQEIEHKKKIFLTDKKVVLTQNEQLDGFPIGEKILRELRMKMADWKVPERLYMRKPGI